MAITIDGTNGLTTDNAALKLDGTTLVVDDTNNRVGIGTASPAVALDVSGYARASTGILFGTDTAAANALDDYEEGTWTPTVSSAGGTITSYTSSGTYTKIGSLVFLSAKVEISNKGTATGGVRITNPPFKPSATIDKCVGGWRNDTTGSTGTSLIENGSNIYYLTSATVNNELWHTNIVFTV